MPNTQLKDFLRAHLEASVDRLVAEVTETGLPLHNVDLSLRWANVEDDETGSEIRTTVEAYRNAEGVWFVEERSVLHRRMDFSTDLELIGTPRVREEF